MGEDGERDGLTGSIIGAAIEVHRVLGPGLLESAYRVCLAHELKCRGHQVQQEIFVPIEYKGLTVPDAYRLDMLVDEEVIVETKCAADITKIHEAQLLTYLRLTGKRTGLLLNFHVVVLKNGIRRMVL